ncbi:MAG: tRNA (guanosine(46)-N7)-methyltransferase TrmB [Spirochaetaceae bacterium]|jgi:tRNA (guanine-N7-)-methyltransferase|nr:tRNA (guanosine(46)-N7)-methyltransferase TrmB [Spirochaetaceae bacterium]
MAGGDVLETGEASNSGGFRIKSYVLRSGRTSKAQQRSLDRLSGAYCVPFTESPIDFRAVFGNDNHVTVEIGFGMGSATAEIASENPQKNYIGIEVFRAGVGRLLWEIENRRLANVRIIEHDAIDVLEKMIPDGSLDAFHIFFPDPWLKKRHRKRRLVKRPFTDILASKLKNGGYICMVSDCADYCDSALAELSAVKTLRNACLKFAPRQRWRPITKFEEKSLSRGRAPTELLFIKE